MYVSMCAGEIFTLSCLLWGLCGWEMWMAAERWQRIRPPTCQKGEHGLRDKWELDPWPLGRGSSGQRRLLGHQEGLWGVWGAKQIMVPPLLYLCLGNASRSWNCRSGAAVTAAVKSPAPLEQHWGLSHGAPENMGSVSRVGAPAAPLGTSRMGLGCTCTVPGCHEVG